MLELAADDRGAQREDSRAGDLAEQLGPSVEVDRVGLVVLAVASGAAGEDAVGAEMDQARAGWPAERREAVGEQRVHRDARDRIGRLGALFHDPDRVHHDGRTGRREGALDRVECGSVDPEEWTRRPEDRGQWGLTRAERRPHVEVLARQDLAELVSEHSGAAEDEDACRR